MRIFKSETEEGFMKRIIVGRRDSDFSKYLSTASEKNYAVKRVDAGKEVTVFPGENGTTWIQVLEHQKISEYELLEKSRLAAHAMYRNLKDHDAPGILIINNGVSASEIIAFAEGLFLTDYRFDKYLGEKRKETFRLEETGILCESTGEKDLTFLKAILQGTFLARDLVNEPLSWLTAEKLAEEISARGKEAGYTTEVFNKKKIESLRMGGLLAVNRGSIDPPTFSILQWKPDDAFNEKPFVLVGKGVVYDTGGLSLKPTYDSMDYMKCDMAGAAAVAGALYAIASSGLPVHVIGLVPATDNRPDGNAYVPGDVVKMYDGTTVEVLNTDAEGRMILADALSYAGQYDPGLVIELSTLTGAAHAALGNNAIAGMGNAGENIMNELKEAGYSTYERIAELPFWDDYAEMLKSDIADLKNIGGKYAGAITAGKFLEKFTAYPFVHLDIAGPAFNKTEEKYRGKGGSGVGVRLLFEYFKKKSSTTP